MRKTKCLFLIAGAILMGSCGNSDKSASPNVFTVSYYDDSAEPVLVGYAYVIKDRAANMRSVEGVDYDKLSHAGNMPSAVGKHFVFDGFKGTYEDGTEIDLDSIQSDCSVYATFVEKDYELSYTFKNGAVSIRDDKDDLIKGVAKYGDSFSFTSLGIDFEALEYSVPRFGYNYEYDGFSVDADSTKTAITDAMLQWMSGDELPAVVEAPGTLFVSKENMASNPEYATYYSNGTEWISVGKLSDNLKLSFSCSFSEVEKDFSVTIVKAGVELGTLKAKYGSEEIKIEPDASKLKISNSRGMEINVEASTYTAKYIKYTSAVADKIQENYSEKDVDLKHIMGDCVITVA